MPNLRDNLRLWRDSAQIDWFSQFIKAWIPFNAWMTDTFGDLTDRELLDHVKGRGNVVYNRIVRILTRRLAELAAAGIYVGTSSWKYEGWLGTIYSPEKYLRYFQKSPPKIQKKRFQDTCLAEYAETFPTVCFDGGYYQFPTPQMLERFFSQVPPNFRLSLKVTDMITVLRWPNYPEYGSKAGQSNSDFLNADLFLSSFLSPLAPYRDRVGTLIFEFS